MSVGAPRLAKLMKSAYFILIHNDNLIWQWLFCVAQSLMQLDNHSLSKANVACLVRKRDSLTRPVQLPSEGLTSLLLWFPTTTVVTPQAYGMFWKYSQALRVPFITTKQAVCVQNEISQLYKYFNKTSCMKMQQLSSRSCHTSGEA